MSNIREVAKACGVSVATVSYVINNGPRAVHVETRHRVLQTIRELGYRPRSLHVGERAKRTNTIGVLFIYKGQLRDNSAYFRPVLDGILPWATEHDQNILLFNQRDWSNAHRSLRNYCDGRCDGLLLLSVPSRNDIIPALQERGFPFILLGNAEGMADVPCVDMDNVAAAAQMTNYLLAQGHRRIAMFPGDTAHGSAARRVTGYLQALQSSGLPANESLILQGGFEWESGYTRAHDLVRSGKDRLPSAVFCGSDMIALGAIQAFHECGLRVPEDISVAGFDDIAEAAISSPPLTTMHQSLCEQGRRGIEMLHARIHGEGIETPREILPTEIVIRDSVGPPAQT